MNRFLKTQYSTVGVLAADYVAYFDATNGAGITKSGTTNFVGIGLLDILPDNVTRCFAQSSALLLKNIIEKQPIKTIFVLFVASQSQASKRFQ